MRIELSMAPGIRKGPGTSSAPFPGSPSVLSSRRGVAPSSRRGVGTPTPCAHWRNNKKASRISHPDGPTLPSLIPWLGQCHVAAVGVVGGLSFAFGQWPGPNPGRITGRYLRQEVSPFRASVYPPAEGAGEDSPLEATGRRGLGSAGIQPHMVVWAAPVLGDHARPPRTPQPPADTGSGAVRPPAGLRQRCEEKEG